MLRKDLSGLATGENGREVPQLKGPGFSALDLPYMVSFPFHRAGGHYCQHPLNRLAGRKRWPGVKVMSSSLKLNGQSSFVKVSQFSFSPKPDEKRPLFGQRPKVTMAMIAVKKYFVDMELYL